MAAAGRERALTFGLTQSHRLSGHMLLVSLLATSAYVLKPVVGIGLILQRDLLWRIRRYLYIDREVLDRVRTK